jgi:membrane associated rhomboid family serine protease
MFALSLEGLRDGRYWQLVTYMFMHGGYLHLGFNGFQDYALNGG